MARCPSTQCLVHAFTSCTSPRRGRGCVRSRRGTRRPASGRSTGLALTQLSFELVRSPLADDEAVVDDREPVAQCVRLLQVLRCEEDGRARSLMRRTSSHTVRRLAGRARSWARRGTGRRARAPTPTRGRAGASCRRIALMPPVGRVLELHQLEQILARSRRSRARARTAAPAARAAPGRSGEGRARPPVARPRSCGGRHRDRGHIHARNLRGARRDRQQRREHADGRRLAAPFGPRNPNTSPASTPRSTPRPPRSPRSGCYSV